MSAPAGYVGIAPLPNPAGIEPCIAGRLGDDLLEQIRQLADEPRDTGGPWRRTATFDAGGRPLASCWARSLPPRSPEGAAVAAELVGVAFRVNTDRYRFDLSGVSPDDPPQILALGPSDGRRGQADLDAQHSRRKLTLLVPLTEAAARPDAIEGIPDADARRLEAGHIISLPAWRGWGLRPSGEERAAWLVGWIDGRPFR